MSPMNNRLLVPRKTPGLLDLVPGAAAAYSLRSLSNSYADPVVTVRRSSDDAEEDFTASEVADGTLAAFCGAGDGFVKQWWDQSGNARHAIQTTPTYQPQIVSGGAVILKEGKPALQFDGVNDRYKVSFSLGPYLSMFSVFSANVTNDFIFDAYDTANINSVWLSPSADFRFVMNLTSGFVMPFRPYTLASQALLSMIHFSDDIRNAWVNGSDSGSAASVSHSPPAPMNGISIGCGGATNLFLDGTYQELIVYETDQTANRELLEGNIAWGWSV